MAIFSRFVLPALLLLLTIASGIGLSHHGKPYPGLFFNFHKLIALAALITAGVQFSRLLSDFSTAAVTVLLGAAAVCALALFISGAFLSLARPAPPFVLRVHQIALPLLLITSLASIFLWIDGSS